MSHATSSNGTQGNSNNWLQGLVIGICIGGAFIGGWLLARQELSVLPGAAPAGRADTPASPVVAAAPEVLPQDAVPAKETLPPPVGPKGPPEVLVSAEEKALVAPVAEAAPEAVSAPPVAEAAGSQKKPLEENPASVLPPPAANMAQLQIATVPDAQVFAVEGERRIYIGQADAEGKFMVSRRVGPRGVVFSLVFRHPDYEELRKDAVRMEGGKIGVLEASMKAAPGALTIVAEPPAATVWVNGKKEGQGVVILGSVPANVKQLVEVKMGGEETVSQEIAVAPRQVATVKIALKTARPAAEEKPAGGAGDILLLGPVYALASEPDARVLVDGRVTPAPDGLLRGIPAGTRQLVIERGGDNVPVRVLWRGAVEVRQNVATSLRELTVAEETMPPVPAKEAPAGQAIFSIQFINLKGEPAVPDQVAVSFAGEPVARREDGTWALPLKTPGDVRVEVPGFEPIVYKGMEYPLAGAYPMTGLLRPPVPEEKKVLPPPAVEEALPEPAPISWAAKALAVAPQEGFFVLEQQSEPRLAVAQELTIAVGEGEGFAVEVVDASEKMAVCSAPENSEKLSALKKGGRVKATLVRAAPAKEKP